MRSASPQAGMKRLDARHGVGLVDDLLATSQISDHLEELQTSLCLLSHHGCWSLLLFERARRRRREVREGSAGMRYMWVTKLSRCCCPLQLPSQIHHRSVKESMPCYKKKKPRTVRENRVACAGCRFRRASAGGHAPAALIHALPSLT